MCTEFCSLFDDDDGDVCIGTKEFDNNREGKKRSRGWMVPPSWPCRWRWWWWWWWCSITLARQGKEFCRKKWFSVPGCCTRSIRAKDVMLLCAHAKSPPEMRWVRDEINNGHGREKKEFIFLASQLSERKEAPPFFVRETMASLTDCVIPSATRETNNLESHFAPGKKER